MAINLVCVPVSRIVESPIMDLYYCYTYHLEQIIYLLYPETKGVQLENMDRLFGTPNVIDEGQTTHLAAEQSASTRATNVAGDQGLAKTV